MDERRTWFLVALGAVLAAVLTFGVRHARGVHAYTSDEVGHLFDGGVAVQFFAEETGVNPPLFRILTAHEPTIGARVERGRSISVESSAVAAALLVVLGFVVSGRWWTGWLAALPFALVETSIRATAQARAYGMWAAVAAAWLLALHLWAREPGDRRRMAAVALLAIPLPWIHYVSVPWLLGVGLGVALSDRALRRLPLLLIPSALTTLPLVWRVLSAKGRRVAPVDGATDMLDDLLGLGVKSPLFPGWQPPAWLMQDRPSVLLSVTLPVLLGLPLLWRRLAPALRIQWIATILVPSVLVVLNTQQVVRPPSIVFLLVGLGPLMAGAAGRLPKAGQAAALAVAMTVGMAWPLWKRAQSGAEAPYLHPDALRAFAVQVREGQLPPGDLLIRQKGMVVPFGLYVTGRLPQDLPQTGRCAGDIDCVEIAGRRVYSREQMEPIARWVADFTFPEFHVPGCVPWPRAPEGAEVYDCAAALERAPSHDTEP